MENQFWKRELLPVWYRQSDPWGELRNVKASAAPLQDVQPSPTWESTAEAVVSKQSSENMHGNELLYPVVAVTTGVLVVLTITAIILSRKRRNKINDEEQASSILVYPSQQGSSTPQFLTKEIHFSLPPLRSTSLGDLNEQEADDDSDYDTDTLLLPSNHNQRSHSFSCYGLGVIEPALYRSTLDLDEIQWPEGHIGRIWFSLRYEPSTEKLLVSLLKAKNLPSRTLGTVSSCDPFVRLHLMPDERRYLQSKQKKKTCNPYFDETLVFQVSAKDMTDHTLKLTVIDSGRAKRRSEIGHVTFPLRDLEIGDGTEQQLFKFDLEKEAQEVKSDLGEILVSLVYNENLNRLTATVIEAKRLKPSETDLPAAHGNSAVVDIEHPNTSPILQQPNGKFAAKNASDIVKLARAQFNSGKTKPIEFRRQQLKNLVRMFEENETALENAVCKDLGKHRLESSAYDVEYSKNHARKMLMHLDEWARPDRPTKPYMNYLDSVSVQKDPYGVVLVISPWNFPLNLLFVPVSGAIAAGNCVVMKPSEISSATAKIVAELVPKYLDRECFPVYLGGVQETADLLKQRFDYIFFTGSTTVGRIVHAAANKYLTPVTLELGGKSPVYIDDTVDIELAAKRILWGKCINAGQICIAPDYVLCTKKVQDAFIVAATKQLQKWFGNDMRNSMDYARIISDTHFERLTNFLKDKSNIAIGGKTDPSVRFLEPTILINVNPNDPIMQEEIFGPILPILTVRNVNEAVSFINAREKPLALYIFTNDKATKKLILNSTSSGGVTVNDTIMHFSVETLPFGGVGSSGMGACHGRATFDTFTHRKGILEKNYSRLLEKLTSVRYPPYSDRKADLLNFAIRPRMAMPVTFLKYVLVFVLGIVVSFIFHHFCG